jgi:hypothetical protein
MTKDPDSLTPLDAVKGSLSERRAKIVEDLVLELEVPHYDDPPVIVRFHPVENKAIKAALRKAEQGPKSERDEAELEANAGLLVKACVGLTSGSQSWSGFGDTELAAELGVSEQRAIAVCRALYVTDGDLMSHAAAVVRFSGYKETEIEEDFTGE